MAMTSHENTYYKEVYDNIIIFINIVFHVVQKILSTNTNRNDIINRNVCFTR